MATDIRSYPVFVIAMSIMYLFLGAAFYEAARRVS
jgi:hypothetical protein